MIIDRYRNIFCMTLSPEGEMVTNSTLFTLAIWLFRCYLQFCDTLCTPSSMFLLKLLQWPNYRYKRKCRESYIVFPLCLYGAV